MDYQKLFNYMSENHGVDLLETDMQEICNIVNEMNEQQPAESVCDECEDGSGWYDIFNCSKCNPNAI
jgi:hypothetical protein